MRADAALYYSTGRRFSPSQGPRTGLGPPGTGAFFTPGDTGN